jgi:hypothetical protein
VVARGSGATGAGPSLLRPSWNRAARTIPARSILVVDARMASIAIVRGEFFFGNHSTRPGKFLTSKATR